jgi:hypothetical protein
VIDALAEYDGGSEIESYLRRLLKRSSKLHSISVIIALVCSLIGAASLVACCYWAGSITSMILLYLIGGWIVSAAVIYAVISSIVRKLVPALSQLVRYNLYERHMLQAVLDEEFQASIIMKRFPGLFKNKAINAKSLSVRSFKQQLRLFHESMYINECVYFRATYLPQPYYTLSRGSYIFAWLTVLANSINNLNGWIDPPIFGLLMFALVAYTIPYGIIITACVRLCLVGALYEAYFDELPADQAGCI